VRRTCKAGPGTCRENKGKVGIYSSRELMCYEMQAYAVEYMSCGSGEGLVRLDLLGGGHVEIFSGDVSWVMGSSGWGWRCEGIVSSSDAILNAVL
jgi:hypothetical protein